MKRLSVLASLLVLCLPTLVSAATADGSPRVLFLSKSSGFEHDVIKAGDDGSAVVQAVLADLADEHGFAVHATKDASVIDAERLADYDVVIFYTTGDLSKSGSGEGLFGGDGQPAMGETGVSDLLSWIEQGGGFLGFHCATDTFKSTDVGLEKDETTPYIAMIGGQFRGHGPQFEGTVRVVDEDHPAAARLPADWRITDEWYAFSHFDADAVNVIATLDAGEFKEKLPKLYGGDDYPVIWTKDYGAGRVYYNAMGHREDVWENPDFQRIVVDAIRWAAAGNSGDEHE